MLPRESILVGLARPCRTLQRDRQSPESRHQRKPEWTAAMLNAAAVSPLSLRSPLLRLVKQPAPVSAVPPSTPSLNYPITHSASD